MECIMCVDRKKKGGGGGGGYGGGGGRAYRNVIDNMKKLRRLNPGRHWINGLE